MRNVIDQLVTDKFSLYNADCIDVLQSLPDCSIDYSIFSPPFASLFTYSNFDRDLGNSKSHEVFYEHFEFVIRELFRVLRPGRVLSIHVSDLPASKQFNGFIGLIDFPGILCRKFESVGFYKHSEVVIWKDPVVAMQRTKAIGLLWKQIKKDSAMSRQGIPDKVITFRKPGMNDRPINHTAEEFPVSLWQQLASPCWMDIRQSNTLNRKLAREESDERHICPLQLDLIERCIFLWSNPGDIVLSPFAGIGSEGFVSIAMRRFFIGAELKTSYFKIASDNLIQAQDLPNRFPQFQNSIGDWRPDGGGIADGVVNPSVEIDKNQMSLF